MKIGKRTRIVLIVLAAVVVVGVARWYMVFGWHDRAKPGFTLSRETTFITEPLNPDGTVDYLTAINTRYGKGVTKEKNAVVPVVEAIGPRCISEEVSDQYFAALGVDPPAEEGQYFVGWVTYVEEHVLTAEQRKQLEEAEDSVVWGGEFPPAEWPPASAPVDPMDKFEEAYEAAMKRSWTVEEFPNLSRWLEANEAPLEKVKAASRRPRWFSPLVSPEDPPNAISSLMMSIGLVRDMCRALILRANKALGRDDFEAAHEDLMAVHRLARLLSQSPLSLTQIVSSCVAKEGAEGHLVLAGQNPSAERAKTYLVDLEALAEMEGLADCFNYGERFFMLDTVMAAARAGDYIPELEKVGSASGVNWDVSLRRANEWWDIQVALAKAEDEGEISALKGELQRMETDLENAWRRIEERNTFWFYARCYLLGREYIAQQLSEIFADYLSSVFFHDLAKAVPLYRREVGCLDDAKAPLARVAEEQPATAPAQ